MKAIILAGGEGTRLRGVISDIPKPMAPISGKPFLEYILTQLKNQGICDIIISTGYKADCVKSYFKDGNKWGINIIYSHEETPLGTGGALKKAVELFDDEYFLLINGDTFIDVELDRVLRAHKVSKAVFTLVLVKVADTQRYGKVAVASNMEVDEFIEKGEVGSGLINGGYSFLHRKVAGAIGQGRISLESEVLPQFIHKGLYSFVVDGFFIDIGIPTDYLELARDPSRLLSAVNRKFNRQS